MTQIAPLHSAPQPAPRRRAVAALRELVLVVAMFGIYFQIRRFTSKEVRRADDNARLVVRWEQAVGIAHELSIQRFALRADWMIWILDHYYVLAHFPASLALLTWVFLRRQRAYRVVRFWFLIVTGCGLVIHLLFPLTPPRLLAGAGFVDTLDLFGPDIYTDNIATSTANQLAAMPSLHFAWALLVAIIVVRLYPRRWSMLAFIHPTMTFLGIVGTGNHWILDAIVGAVLVVVAVAVLPMVRAVRPDVPAEELEAADAA